MWVRGWARGLRISGEWGARGCEFRERGEMGSVGQGGQGGEFGVYQNAAISSALSAMSVRPSRRDITVIVALSLLSASLLVVLTSRYIIACWRE